jgi:hypothetical protein
MLYAEMFEVAGYFTVVGDGCYNSHVAFTMLTLSHIDLKDFSQHFVPARVLRGLSSVQLLLGDFPFFSSGFRTTFLRQGEFGANTPLHLTRWDFGGGMMAFSFSINSPGVNRRCDVPSL